MRSVFLSLVRCAAASFALCIAPYYSIRTWAYVLDPDIWWRIRVGDWIVAHHAVPRYAIFSQHLERQWIAYSWLLDLIVSRVVHHFGLMGIPAFLTCFQVLISLVFLLAIRHFARSFWWSWLIGVLTMCACYLCTLRMRPMQFSLLFLIIELWLIFETERDGNDKRLFWTVPLFVLWANIHIQFIYGLFVLALYVGVRIAAVVARQWLPIDSRETSPGRLLAILAAAIAGSCIGPNWVYPYKVVLYYVTHSRQYQLISEFLAMDFRRPEHYLALVLLMAACYGLHHSRRLDLFRPALLLAAAVVSFRSQRDTWFVSVVASFVLAEAVGQAYSKKVESQGEVRTRPALNYALALALALCLSFGLTRYERLNAQHLFAVIGEVFPVGGTQFVRGSHLPGPMYNSFTWGGFLIFNLREQPVSIDPRGNAYDDELIARSMSTLNAIDWQGDPDLSRANLVLLEQYAPLASALRSDPRYRLAYQDSTAVVFVRQQDHAPGF